MTNKKNTGKHTFGEWLKLLTPASRSRNPDNISHEQPATARKKDMISEKTKNEP